MSKTNQEVNLVYNEVNLVDNEVNLFDNELYDNYNDNYDEWDMHEPEHVQVAPVPPRRENVADAVAEIARHLGNIASESGSHCGSRDGHYNLLEFDGNALKFMHFRRSYDSTKMHFSDEKNISRILKATTGQAKQLTDSMVPIDPDQLMNALAEHFGDSEIVASRVETNLRSIPALGSNEISLGQFASRLSNGIEVLHAHDLGSYVQSPTLVKCIAKKLPFTLRFALMTWASVYKVLHSEDSKKSDLELLAAYLHEQAAAAKGSLILSAGRANGTIPKRAQATVTQAAVAAPEPRDHGTGRHSGAPGDRQSGLGNFVGEQNF